MIFNHFLHTFVKPILFSSLSCVSNYGKLTAETPFEAVKIPLSYIILVLLMPFTFHQPFNMTKTYETS